MNFMVHIITPTAPFFEGEISCVTLPLSDGSMQFLARHSEELTTVKDGAAYLRTPSGEKVDFFTSGGVFYFAENEAYLMVEHAATPADWSENLKQRAETLKREQERRRQSREEHLLSTVALNKAFVAMHGSTRNREE